MYEYHWSNMYILYIVYMSIPGLTSSWESLWPWVALNPRPEHYRSILSLHTLSHSPSSSLISSSLLSFTFTSNYSSHFSFSFTHVYLQLFTFLSFTSNYNCNLHKQMIISLVFCYVTPGMYHIRYKILCYTASICLMRRQVLYHCYIFIFIIYSKQSIININTIS